MTMYFHLRASVVGFHNVEGFVTTGGNSRGGGTLTEIGSSLRVTAGGGEGMEVVGGGSTDCAHPAASRFAASTPLQTCRMRVKSAPCLKRKRHASPDATPSVHIENATFARTAQIPRIYIRDMRGGMYLRLESMSIAGLTPSAALVADSYNGVPSG